MPHILTTCFLLAFGASVNAGSGTPQKIVVLAPHLVELVYELGAGDRIVATSDYADYPEAARNILRVGGHMGIQIETVLALEPDLILAWEGGNQERDLQRFEQLGLPLYRSKTASLADIAVEFEKLGTLLHVESAARAAAQKFLEQWQAIKRSNEKKRPVSFFYQLWSNPLKSISSASWMNEIMRACGGHNVIDDAGPAYPQVSIETVLLRAPEVIIVPSQQGKVTRAVEYWSDWPEIPAVAEKNIVFIDGDLLHRFSPRVINGMRAVCAAFDRVRSKQQATKSSLTGDAL